MPLRVLLDRNRGAAFISIFMVSIGMFAVFLFLTYYLQLTKDTAPYAPAWPTYR